MPLRGKRQGASELLLLGDRVRVLRDRYRRGSLIRRNCEFTITGASELTDAQQPQRQRPRGGEEKTNLGHFGHD